MKKSQSRWQPKNDCINAVRLHIDVDGKKKLLSAIDTHHKMQLKQANAQYM